MKEQNVDRIVEKVRVVLEQNLNPADLADVGDLHTLTIEQLIVGVLEEAVSVAVTNADESLFENVSEAMVEGKEFVALPSGVQRIMMVEGDTWRVPVKEVLKKSSELYRMCCNRYIKSVGVKERPMAFLSYNEGVRGVRLFPAAEKEARVQYIGRSVIREKNVAGGAGGVGGVTITEVLENALAGSQESVVSVIECDDSLVEGVCYYAAYLVATIQGWQNSEGLKAEAMVAWQVGGDEGKGE